jgi:hypothetical protein
MPYTKSESRKKFVEYVEELVRVVADQTKSFYVQGEYWGYFVNRLVKRYLRLPDVESEAATSFNARAFPEPVRKALNSYTDKMVPLIDSGDPINSAGDLNYAISSVLWGIAGDCQGLAATGYGQRAYLKGIVQKIEETVLPLYGTGNADSVMNFRRHIVVKGVLGDVLDEWYVRKMVPYEQKKMEENGDIWVDGKLFVK